ncbi:MAG TPA: site-specific integrase [Rhizomicrobium sp.]|nr:site-specific integrase [Rhizomicrobium sp.]
MEWSLYDGRGRRKYLVQRERGAFLRAALQVRGKTASFCAVLTLTGARISEVLALTPERIDDANSAINFETLKRRKGGVIRAVPVPHNLLMYLEAVHRYREAQKDPAKAGVRLWSWSRTTAWRRVKMVMKMSANPEFLAKPKSLRHAFGAEAASKLVSLTLIKKWMGHADLRSTEIYTTLLGPEERALARRTWKATEALLRPKFQNRVPQPLRANVENPA